MKGSNHKELWVDYVRVVATFSVVLLHSAAPSIYIFNDLTAFDWHVANIYDSLVRTCVPLFFMLSGFLLLEREEPWMAFYKKRITKVLVPLIMWTVFYLLWRRHFEVDVESEHSIYSVLLAGAHFHLWFLYALIGLYLYIPILQKIVKDANKNFLYYFIALWFTAVAVIPLGEELAGVESHIDLKSIAGYSGYMVLGLVLGKLVVTRAQFRAAVLAALICVLVTAYGTYVLTSRNDGLFSGYFYAYLAPNIVIFSVATFLIIRFVISRNEMFSSQTMSSAVQKISSASLGIYCLHPAFLYLIWNQEKLGLPLAVFAGHPIYSIPLTAAVVFTVSMACVFVIKKIPVLRAGVP